MCGIAGSVNHTLSYSTIDKVMLHRGPDEQNGYAHQNVDLYHLRLSILDAAGGKQPMHFQNRYTIIFNGEIYNHAELRKQFGLEGGSYSDTETILMLYHRMKEKCLDLFDGMFALAIYDSVERNIFLARDRAGKKPLYLFNDGNRIMFASELNCLKANLPLQLDERNLLQYMRLGVFYKSLTPYKNVKELEPGSYAYIDCNNLSVNITKWWNVHDFYLAQSADSFETALEKTNELLTASVKRRLESSDLEVGCFLSGGIDSGLVTSIASRHSGKIKTLTVSFDGEYDEAPLAKLVADKYDTSHTVVGISFDKLRNDVEQIIANYGEPFYDSSAIPSYYVSEAAKKLVTVILNGDGADELFAGYRRYVPFSKYDFFRKSALITGSAKAAISCLPAPDDKKSKYNYLYRLLNFAGKSGLDIYFAAGVDIIEGYEKQLLTDSDEYLKEMISGFEHINRSSLSGLKKIMNLDFDNNFSGQMLTKMDIATMQHSLEGRSPFMSKELLEYAPTLHDSYKINGTSTKHLLRILAKRYLPETLVHQPKRGFEIPLKNWVNGQLNEIIGDYLMDAGACHRSIIKKGFIEQVLQNRIKMPAEKRAKLLWTVFSLEVWYKKVYLS